MEFREKLLKVDQVLNSDDTKALAFLCKDILKCDISSVESPIDLFQRLEEKDVLSEDQPYLLADLLRVIELFQLLRELDLNGTMSTTVNPITPYRKLLYELSKDIGQKELKKIKFLLSNDLQRSALELNVSTLEVFLEMERMDLLSSSNLLRLEQILRDVHPVLRKQIQQFKDSQGKIAQETGLVDLRRRSSLDASRRGKSTLEVFLEKERMDLQNSSYLDLLEQIVKDVCPVLWKQIHQFKDSPGKIAQATGLVDLRALSVPSSDASRRGKDQTDPPPYPMKAQQRGFCLIVSNFDFSRSSGKHKNREGTDIDEECLRRVFTWLGFQVEVVQDATSKQMLSSMEELASRDHSGMDCVACIVLSHGLEGGVYGVDGGKVQLKKLTDLLNGVRCASLRGKPKLFFIQACQGNKKEQAFPVPANRPTHQEVSDQTDGPSSSGVHTQTDGPSSPGDLCSDASVASESLPSMADFLISRSTPPSYISLRDMKKGSWYIQSLCQNLVHMVPREKDLVSILMAVNEDVSQKSNPNSSRRQMPEYTSNLRKRLIFPVPEDSRPRLPTSL